MKNKMCFLIKQSLNKKIKTKWFKIVNIILLILFIGVINIDKLISHFGGDFNEPQQIILASDIEVFDEFRSYFTSSNEKLKDLGNYEIIKNEEAISTVLESLEDENKILVEIHRNENEYIDATITSYDAVDTITYQLLENILNTIKSEYALTSSGVNAEEIMKVTSPINIDKKVLNPDLTEDAEAKETASNIILIIFIMPFFIFTVLLVQMIGAEINDEKTTKSMEIIISNVSPKVHFLSKIISSISFVLIQCILFIIYTIIGLLIRYFAFSSLSINENNSIIESIKSVIEMLKNTGILSTLTNAIPLIAILLLATLLAYAILAGVLASMTTSIEDFQQLQTPLMIICVFGYYLAFASSLFEGATFIKIFSYIPFFSAMIAPTLYLMGQTTIINLLISTLISILTCFLLMHYGLRVYKEGILNYSSKDLWKKLFKSIKQKD